MTVAGVVLAAGGGSRFGRPKALVRFRGTPLVERGVDMLRAAGCSPVVAVLGADAHTVVEQARLGDAVAVVNDAWAGGVATSLRAGIAALHETAADAIVVALADQPLVTSTAVQRLIAAWKGGAVAAAATYDGRLRNPVLLDRSVWHAVAEAAVADAGARVWLTANADRVARVACDDVASPDDIDTTHDRARLESVTPRS